VIGEFNQKTLNKIRHIDEDQSDPMFKS